VRNFLPRPAANHRGAFLFILFAFFIFISYPLD
jgi:hypothetical protein